MRHLKRLVLLSMGLLSLGGLFYSVQHTSAQASVPGSFVAMPGGGDYDPEPEERVIAKAVS